MHRARAVHIGIREGGSPVSSTNETAGTTRGKTQRFGLRPDSTRLRRSPLAGVEKKKGGGVAVNRQGKQTLGTDANHRRGVRMIRDGHSTRGERREGATALIVMTAHDGLVPIVIGRDGAGTQHPNGCQHGDQSLQPPVHALTYRHATQRLQEVFCKTFARNVSAIARLGLRWWLQGIERITSKSETAWRRRKQAGSSGTTRAPATSAFSASRNATRPRRTRQRRPRRKHLQLHARNRHPSHCTNAR